MQQGGPTEAAGSEGRTFLDRDGYYVSDEIFRAPSLTYRIDAITLVRMRREKISRAWGLAAVVLAALAGALAVGSSIVLAVPLLLAVLALVAAVRALSRAHCLDVVVQNTLKVRLMPGSRELLHALHDALNQALRQRQQRAASRF